ncbi:MAG: alpha/beta hydrolase, partial [Leptolyngbya sp.]|nr:alpha/beta hydrolase [Candidatus Melainabacteria bacterium]
MARVDSTIELLDGKTLGYSTFGNPDGVPLLYFHGGISSRLDIEFADQESRQLNIRLIAPDRQGIGLSDRLKGRTLTHWTETVHQLITALDLNKPAILGWSLGGPYALACAA